MSAISLINSGVAWFVAAAVLAFLFSFQKTLSGWIAGIGGAVGSLYTAAAGFTVLTGALGVSGALSLVSYDVQISPLNAIWLITLGLCGLFVSLYNIDWHRHAQVKCNGLQINMLMAAAVCAVIASNLGMFVVMAEIMALCAVFLTSNSKEGKLWFALGRLGTLLLAIACWLLWQRYGTLDLRLLDMRMQQLPLGSDIWLLGVIGFGLLAGIIPLHGWVPQAHANASAPAAALFSTVVMKIGLLGILTLSLLGGNAPLWWGIALLVLGMITAFVGGLYHLLNHSLFKSVLFLGAGSVWFRTGHRDIEKLGGIGKKMPVISIAMLVGLMAMAALPPLNGFAGEWVIYQSFFKLSNSGAFVARLLGPLLAVGLAITGALAVMCMAKVYGVTFLGAPRTKEAENATCAPLLMSVSVVALAICCVIGGVAAPWLLPMLSAAVPLPLEPANTTVSQPMITLLLIACPSNALTVETDLATGELAWEFNLGRCIFCGRCEEVCPTAAIKLSQEYELAVWKKEDFLQQSRFVLCSCRVCNRPFAVQKEIDYAIALLKHNGDSRAENHRESFETCPECKRQKCLVPSDRIELTRHMKEAI